MMHFGCLFIACRSTIRANRAVIIGCNINSSLPTWHGRHLSHPCGEVCCVEFCWTNRPSCASPRPDLKIGSCCQGGCMMFIVNTCNVFQPCVRSPILKHLGRHSNNIEPIAHLRLKMCTAVVFSLNMGLRPNASCKSSDGVNAPTFGVTNSSNLWNESPHFAIFRKYQSESLWRFGRMRWSVVKCWQDDYKKKSQCDASIFSDATVVCPTDAIIFCKMFTRWLQNSCSNAMRRFGRMRWSVVKGWQ